MILVGTAVGANYTGWGPTAVKGGIRGYLMQATYPTFGNGAVFSWLGLCGYGCVKTAPVDGGSPQLQWVQTGLFQGYFAGGSSLSAVHMYYENKDPCNDYYADDIGAPPDQPYFFLVKYDGAGAKTFHCSNGTPFTGYSFLYKKGSSASTPFYWGVMGTDDGRADANTEWNSPTYYPTSYFGCRTSTNCTNSAYGIEVYGSSWKLCCGNPRSIRPANPPWRHTYSDYWGFKSCGTEVLCSPAD